MRRRAVRASLVALAVVALAARAVAAEETTRYMLRAEAGVEYDSNAHRTETIRGAPNPPDPVGSPLARGVITGSLNDIIGPGQDIAVAATAAGKLFSDPDARGEDVAVAESSLVWGAQFSPHTRLSVSGLYYEGFQRGGPDPADANERRDFRSLTGALRLGMRVGPSAELGVGAGYRLFVFKPDRDFDFRAPLAGVDLRWLRETADDSAEWEVSTGAAYERRAFAGPAFVNVCGSGPSCFPAPGPNMRVDDFLSAHLQLTRTGRVMLGAGYAFQYSSSNSFGDTVSRHFITARFAAELPLAVYLTARAEVLFARYPQGTIVGQFDPAGRTFASIEDENRSSARVDLSRNLTDRLQLIARYTFYGPALTGTPVAYRRQTALLSLAFTIEK